MEAIGVAKDDPEPLSVDPQRMAARICIRFELLSCNPFPIISLSFPVHILFHSGIYLVFFKCYSVEAKMHGDKAEL